MENLDLKHAHFSATETHYKNKVAAFIKFKDIFICHCNSKTALFKHKTRNVDRKKTRQAATLVYKYCKNMKQKYQNSA